MMGPGAGKVSSQGGGKARLYATNRDSGVRVEVAVLAQAAAAEVELPGQEITVDYQHSVFDMGDGSTLTCPRTTPWVKGRQPVGASSPTCGHVYHQPGQYTVTATHHWTLTWHGAGQSGTIPLSTTASHPLKVGELISVITHRHHD